MFALRFKSSNLRYLAIYGVGTLMAYSIVKYKTPWCIISFIWPFLFTFGAMVTIAPLRFKGVTYRWFGLYSSDWSARGSLLRDERIGRRPGTTCGRIG